MAQHNAEDDAVPSAPFVIRTKADKRTARREAPGQGEVGNIRRPTEQRTTREIPRSPSLFVTVYKRHGGAGTAQERVMMGRLT
jgi:hypothetical protein